MSDQPFVVSGVRVTHREVSVAELENAAYEDPQARVRDLLGQEPVNEAFVFQTCNRIEEYVVTETPQAGQAVLADFSDLEAVDVTETGHEASLRHLLRVAAGLESQVLGEDEVLGQFRSAYTETAESGGIGPVLEAALLKAIHVGERARTETSINEGIVSLGSAAVELATQKCDLTGATAVIVGAGSMAERIAASLSGIALSELRIVNRTVENAAALAAEVSMEPAIAGLDELPTHLAAADVVITSTGSRLPVIDEAAATGIGDTVLIDLGQPHDIAADVRSLPEPEVFDLDDLTAVTANTHAERADAAESVEAIVDEEFDLLMDQYKRKRADAVIAGMYRGAERMKEREVSRALARLDEHMALSDESQEIVEELADSLVNQLLAVPTKSLRDAAAEDDWETIVAAIELFDPEVDDPAEFFAAASRASEHPAEGTSE